MMFLPGYLVADRAERDQFIRKVGRRDRCHFGMIVDRGNFDDVGADEVESGQAPQNPGEFSCGETADLWSAGCGSERRVEYVSG